MRRLAKSNKLNKGFSLIEVLVAMAVITLISIPLLRTFVTSAQINTKAKKLQNATDIAQNVSENFTTIPLVTLSGQYEKNEILCGEYLKTNNMVVFKNLGDGSVDENDIPYFKGNDGEKFYVTVTMNPDEYSKSGTIVGVENINDYIVPSMGDLFSTDVVTAYSQFTKYDNRIRTAFRTEYPDVEAFFEEGFGNDDIKKEVYVYIKQTPSGSYIEYEYSMTVKYIYCTSHTTDYVESTYYIDYDFTLASGTISKSEDLPELFLLYTPFDRFDTAYSGTYARDEIYISYMEGEQYVESEEEPMDIYIIEQSVTKGLDKSKIYLKHHKNAFYSGALNNYGTANNKYLMIYSTIDGWPENVTSGKEHLLELYEVQVYVRYNEPDGNDITYYANGKFNTDDVYTQVSAIKEEKPRTEQ